MYKQRGFSIFDALPLLMILGFGVAAFITINNDNTRTHQAIYSQDRITFELNQKYSDCRNSGGIPGIKECEHYAVVSMAHSYLVNFDELMVRASVLKFNPLPDSINKEYQSVYAMELNAMSTKFKPLFNKCHNDTCKYDAFFNTGIEYLYPVEKMMNFAKATYIQVPESFDTDYKTKWLSESSKQHIRNSNI